MVLVDTTVWLDFLRNRDTKSVAKLKKLLQAGDAVIVPVILQELLQGASSPENFERLRAHFSALPTLRPEDDTATHVAAAALYARCRWQGITPRSPHDCLIAQLCIEHKISLLHDDRDFDLLARVEPKLKLIPRG
ncbi:MAG TPA: PIN domain nuclease [Burkholderiales bacterium]|nr:PIN domain nuclease [Burkholderiales bacterium]